jgi:hypothetical protein
MFVSFTTIALFGSDRFGFAVMHFFLAIIQLYPQLLTELKDRRRNFCAK